MAIRHKNPIMRALVWSVVLISLLIVLAVMYTLRLQKAIENEVNVYLTEITAQSVSVLEKQIHGDLHSLMSLSRLIGSGQYSTPQEVIPILKRENDNNLFKRMGVLNEQGHGYTSDGYTMDMGHRQYFKDALNGIPTISDALCDVLDQGQIIVYAVPLKLRFGSPCVMFSTHSLTTFQSILSLNSFNGNGNTYVINSAGDVVLSTNIANIQGFNIFSDNNQLYINDPEERSSIQKIILDKSKSIVKHTQGESERYISIAPCGIRDWYLLSVVPTQVVTVHASNFEKFSLVASILVVVVFAILLIYLFLSQIVNQYRFRRLAYSDSVSGIGNQNKFLADCRDILSKKSPETYALICFDIIKFKLINDQKGYATGSHVLYEIGCILKDHMPKNALYARMYNDTFAILLPVGADFNYDSFCNDLCDRISQIATPGGAKLKLALTIGIYTILPHERDLSACLDRVLIAKAQAKENRGCLYQLYDEEMRKQMVLENGIEQEMESALASGQFEVYYQPKTHMPDGALIGCEALIRWKHPYKWILTPNLFIPVFERNGFIYQVDLYMMEQVCKNLAHWKAQQLPQLPVSVNLSRVDLEHESLLNDLLSILQRYDILPSQIEIEITESVFIGENNLLFQRLHELKSAGFYLAIDDFGTGYSSLNMLKDMPIDVLKLDKLFVNNIMDTVKERIILQSILSMACALHISVVAEGVETESQVQFLMGIGCKIAQGYFYSPPVPIHEFEVMLHEIKASHPQKINHALSDIF